MQFQLSGEATDATVLAAALRLLDPDVQVAHDVRSGRLEVLSSASSTDVIGALDRLGFKAVPLEKGAHVSGGSTCCGGCG